MYKCQDKDCRKTIPDYMRLTHRSSISGIEVYKCPYCRGQLIKIEKKSKTKNKGGSMK